VKLPAVDRIYTITEGQGITGTLCGNAPCPVEAPAAAAPAKAASHKGLSGMNRRSSVLPQKGIGWQPSELGSHPEVKLRSASDGDKITRHPQSTGGLQTCLESFE